MSSMRSIFRLAGGRPRRARHSDHRDEVEPHGFEVSVDRTDELKKRWSYFIRKVYETDPLTCPKCQGEMRIIAFIAFIDQPDVIKRILKHLGLWEDSHAPPERSPPEKELTFDPSYSQLL